MRWTRFILGSVVAVLLVSVAGPAAAYVDRGTDPQEGVTIDISASTRKVVTIERRRMLTVSVRIVEPDVGYMFWIRLDSRGSTRADFIMIVEDAGNGPRCYIYPQGEPNSEAKCQHVAQPPFGPTLVKGRTPVRTVRPTKRIRWWVDSPPLINETSDRAPDRGWYPN